MSMLEEGALASHFALLGTDGREYALPGGLDGEPLVLVFLRVKCPTCDVAMPYFNRLRHAYPDDWHLWAVSQDDPQRSADYQKRFGLEFPVLIDAPVLGVSRLYDPPSTPTTFLVGRHGRIEYTSEGFAKDDLNELSARLAGIIGVAAVEIASDADGNPAMKPGCMARQLMPSRPGR